MSKLKLYLTRGMAAVFTISSILFAFSGVASAAQITTRSVTLGSSQFSAVTTYKFTFTVPTTATTVKSVSMVPCVAASGTCVTPTLWAGTGATAGQPTSAGLGDTSGWATTDSTATELRLSKTTNSATPAASTPVSVTFTGVTNPSATNTTFFMRITTFSSATWTGAIDTGTVATSTAGQITVTASVDETLSFSLTAATVALNGGNALSTGTASTGTSTMSASTNAGTGYGISVSGTTLTGASGTIAALSSGGTSTTGTPQFGLNLVANTTPSVGTAVSGSGTGAASIANGYGTANSFKFNPAGSDVVASAGAATLSNTFTVSYLANISTATPAGSYSTVLTYVATANF